MSIRFTEYYPEVNAAFSFGVRKILFSDRSPFQKITVVETDLLGRVLLIDDMVMFSESDEFAYHEMIAHVPLFVHPAPKQILIIGGGDGGTVRECLKHDSVKRIDLVDIDEMVSRVCLQYVPSLAKGLLSEKVTCYFRDGVEFVKTSQERYEIIIVDSTDPISVGEGLFTREFYQNCFNRLTDDGILVNQSESPAYMPKLVSSIAGKLRSVFPEVYFYQSNVPTYPSGYWAFGFATKKYHPLKDFQESRYHKVNIPFRYYNSDLHFGAFALPGFFKELVHGD